MKRLLHIASLFLVLAVIVSTSVYLGMRAGKGLAQFFSQFGIAVDSTILIIVLGLIPAFWIVSLIIKTWTAK